MKVAAPTLTETKYAIIIRIPKEWVARSRTGSLTEADVLRLVARGEREFRQGKTQEFGAFLAEHYPAHVRAFRRPR